MSTYQQQAIYFLNQTKTTFKTEFLKRGLHFEGDEKERNIFKCTFKNEKGSFSVVFGASIVDTYEKTFVSKWDSLQSTDLVKLFYGIEFSRYKFTVISTIKVTKSDIEKDLFAVVDLLNEDFFNNYIKEAKKVTLRKQGYHYKVLKDELLNRTADYFKKDIEKSVITQITNLKNERVSTFTTPKEIITPPTAYDVLSCLQKYDVGTFEDFCADCGYDTDSRKAERIYKSVVQEYNKVCKIWNGEELELLQEII